jgi:hypothetical protein
MKPIGGADVRFVYGFLKTRVTRMACHIPKSRERLRTRHRRRDFEVIDAVVMRQVSDLPDDFNKSGEELGVEAIDGPFSQSMVSDQS